MECAGFCDLLRLNHWQWKWTCAVFPATVQTQTPGRWMDNVRWKAAPPPPAKMFQSLPVPTQSAEILQFLYTQVPEVRPDIVGLHVCRWRVVIRRLYCEFPRSKVRKGSSGLSRCWVCVVPLVSFCSTNVEKLICGVLRSSSLDGRFRLGGRASERGREAGDWVTKWTP